jgi:hypothetical protein
VPVHRERAYANGQMAHRECSRTLSHPAFDGSSNRKQSSQRNRSDGPRPSTGVGGSLSIGGGK